MQTTECVWFALVSVGLTLHRGGGNFWRGIVFIKLNEDLIYNPLFKIQRLTASPNLIIPAAYCSGSQYNDNIDLWHLGLALKGMSKQLDVFNDWECTETNKICSQSVIHFLIPLLEALDPLSDTLLDIMESRLFNHRLPVLDKEFKGENDVPYSRHSLIRECLLHIWWLLPYKLSENWLHLTR